MLEEKKALDLRALYTKVLGDKIDAYALPPESFTVMGCEIIEYNEEEASMVVRMPIKDFTLNPYKTMQGGMIVAALDNAIGPLSMLVAPLNMTRRMNTEYIKPLTQKMGNIYVRARLVERKRKRLFFEATIEDKEGKIYTKTTAEHWIVTR